MTIANRGFTWRGLDLCVGQSTKPILTLVVDSTYKHLFRIRYPNGWTSSPANLSRAKDAAHSHARFLLQETAPGASRTAEAVVRA
jgi:hypothetical protein